jgi:RNA polymerase sigma factor (sigma-70 family)
VTAGDDAGASRQTRSFDQEFRDEFERRYQSLYRYLVRLSDDPALAADITQEAFVRLHRRGEMPDDAGAWLVTVANNLFRNQRRSQQRRMRLLTLARGSLVLADPPPPPDAGIEAAERRQQVRGALERLPLRDRQLLLLRCEGYSYRELATALDLTETSVGTLLARAKEAFRRALREDPRASE